MPYNGGVIPPGRSMPLWLGADQSYFTDGVTQYTVGEVQAMFPPPPPPPSVIQNPLVLPNGQPIGEGPPPGPGMIVIPPAPISPPPPTLIVPSGLSVIIPPGPPAMALPIPYATPVVPGAAAVNILAPAPAAVLTASDDGTIQAVADTDTAPAPAVAVPPTIPTWAWVVGGLVLGALLLRGGKRS